MKLSITLLSLLIINLSFSQMSKDRYEPVYYELHTLADFNLKGNVQQIITEHFEAKGEANELAPSYIGKTEYNFNKDGLLTSSFEIRSKGDTFDYKYFTYNLKKQLTKVESENVIFSYTYDAAGNLIMMEYNNNGIIRYTRKLTYDDLNRLLTDKMFGETAPEFTDEYSYLGKTDAIITVVSTSHANPNRNVSEIIAEKTYVYHENGIVKSISYVIKSANTTEYNYTRTYNEAGDILTNIMGDPKIHSSSTNEEFTYNSDGNQTKLHGYYVYLGEGDLLLDQRYLYEFDAARNWVKYTIKNTVASSLENKAKEMTDVQEKIKAQKKRTISYYKN